MRLRGGLLVLLLAAVLAGCGGGDDDNGGDSGATTGGGGNSARPADAILADAGLEICKREEEQIAQSTIGPGLQAGFKFNVAESCGGKTTTPNVVYAFQFSDRESVDAGAQKAQQVWFIRKFGPNVNLGNIPPDEVIPLETLRLGLRADTLIDPTQLGHVDGAGI